MIASGTTRSCFIHYCELLPNSRLADPKNIDKYCIQAVKAPFTQFHAQPENNISEFSNIIISTYSMNYHMWIRACIFGLFAQSMHFMGILQFIAKYMYHERKIEFRSFYENIVHK